MSASCRHKQEEVKIKFSHCTSSEAIYQQIILWGKQLHPFESQWKTDENLVPGCQSLMYLKAEIKNGQMHFTATSDALISAGLAALLMYVYDGETPETVLTCPPLFLEEIGIQASLTPGRANGLASLFLKMKQEALKSFQVKE